MNKELKKKIIDQKPIDDSCPNGFYLMIYIPDKLKVCVEKLDKSTLTEDEVFTFSYQEI